MVREWLVKKGIDGHVLVFNGKLGDIMKEFTIAVVSGKEHVLKQILLVFLYSMILHRSTPDTYI